MYASIDIGTNTVLLLVAEKSEQGLNVIHEEQRVPRLGRNVDRERNLSDEAINHVTEVLNEYKTIIEKNYPLVKDIVVTATSAVRDAGNRKHFISQVKEETGFTITLLSGVEEARFTFGGALSVLPFNSTPTAVVDIGGGSTEIAWGEAGSLIDRYSWNMGSVRFTERYLPDDPPSPEQISKCRRSIHELLEEKLFSFPEDTILVGVAGTATSLAYIYLNSDTYKSSIINNTTVTLSELKRGIENIQSEKANKLAEKYPEVMKGRADIFLAGLLILEQIMLTYGFDQLIVSTGGIRHGAVLERLKK